MEFKERVRQLRKEKKETQAQVAEAIGLQERHYQRFELGENLPGYANLIALADHFEVTLDYLMCRTDQR
ncbi:MAG: helix-turn-helix domain-containing protein [Oscillospiraceae bacterium]|nr:helix-turn-helix domain-containing protein [Oscillospiraceae bacterium]